MRIVNQTIFGLTAGSEMPTAHFVTFGGGKRLLRICAYLVLSTSKFSLASFTKPLRFDFSIQMLTWPLLQMGCPAWELQTTRQFLRISSWSDDQRSINSSSLLTRVAKMWLLDPTKERWLFDEVRRFKIYSNWIFCFSLTLQLFNRPV